MNYRILTVSLACALLIGSAVSAEEVSSKDISLQVAVDRALVASRVVPDYLIEVKPYPWRDGFVRLVGSVESSAQHYLAIETALDVPGVIGVVDQIEIKDVVSLPDVAAPR